MRPEKGMICGYYSIDCGDDRCKNGQCVLLVEVVSYEDTGDLERMRLRVLKHLDDDTWCKLYKNDEFIYEKRKDGQGKELEGLTHYDQSQ